MEHLQKIQSAYNKCKVQRRQGAAGHAEPYEMVVGADQQRRSRERRPRREPGSGAAQARVAEADGWGPPHAPGRLPRGGRAGRGQAGGGAVRLAKVRRGGSSPCEPAKRSLAFCALRLVPLRVCIYICCSFYQLSVGAKPFWPPPSQVYSLEAPRSGSMRFCLRCPILTSVGKTVVI